MVVSCAGPFTVVPAAGVLTIGCTAQGLGRRQCDGAPHHHHHPPPVRPDGDSAADRCATEWADGGDLALPGGGPALPMTGAGWNAVKAAADGAWGAEPLRPEREARRLYPGRGAGVRPHGPGAYRSKAAAAIAAAMGTGRRGRALEVSRNIQSYVFAADLIDLKTFDSGADTRFRRGWRRSKRGPSTG